MSKTFRRKQDDFKRMHNPGKKKPQKEDKRNWDRVPEQV